jgi:hypothetical protein
MGDRNMQGGKKKDQAKTKKKSRCISITHSYKQNEQSWAFEKAAWNFSQEAQIL